VAPNSASGLYRASDLENTAGTAGGNRTSPDADRHTFASWAIAGGVQLFYLARIMGTSVPVIDQTYGHLLPDSEEYLRGLLDDYDSRAEAV